MTSKNLVSRAGTRFFQKKIVLCERKIVRSISAKKDKIGSCNQGSGTRSVSEQTQESGSGASKPCILQENEPSDSNALLIVAGKRSICGSLDEIAPWCFFFCHFPK
jgi:hypothetical protein